MRYDRIERLWSQVRAVGISSIQGYSGDEAGQWKPSDIFKFVLGHSELSKCLAIPVCGNAVSLAFNAAYFEERFGLGWSDFDYLHIVMSGWRLSHRLCAPPPSLEHPAHLPQR